MRHRDFYLQHNAARAISTTAAVDAASIAARPCFLCESNRPAEQEAIQFGNYQILTNPYPIFPGHLTIVSLRHEPQRIAEHIDELLELAEAVLPYTLFYNGPECGASAPDHLHFQAADSDLFPIWNETTAREPIEKNGNICLFDSDPAFFLIKGNGTDVAGGLRRLMMRLPKVEGSPEPRVNLLSKSRNGQTELIVIPRAKHRPDCYGTGEGQVLVSPGTIDMSGVVVAPRVADFNTLTTSQLQDIIDSVSFSATYLKKLLQRL